MHAFAAEGADFLQVLLLAGVGQQLFLDSAAAGVHMPAAWAERPNAHGVEARHRHANRDKSQRSDANSHQFW